MRNLIGLLVIGLAVGIATAATAGPFEDGLAAAQRGDFAMALKLWRPLAAKGDANAQFNLGVMYDHGHGVPQDYVEADNWYRLAAEQGNADAQTNLGSYFRLGGHGVPQDYKEAVRWYRLAAEQGDAGAQNNLGLMYESGHGVAQDDIHAQMWYELGSSSASSEDEKKAARNRDNLAAKMTPAQIEQAREMASRCRQSNYKACD